MTIKEMRKNANLTQEQMATMLFTNASTIRAWENGNKLPSISDMPSIAKALNVDLSDVVDAFAPTTTKYTESLQKKKDIAQTVLTLYKRSANKGMFFVLATTLGLSGVKGVVLSSDRAFLFTEVIPDYPHDFDKLSSIVLMDSNKNRVLLSKKHIIKIKPLSYTCDIFNYEITLDYPVFPSNSTDSNSIRLIFFFD